jgi:hypothetical protein
MKQATLSLSLVLALGACSTGNTAATTTNMSSEGVGWLTEQPSSTAQDEVPACQGLLQPCRIWFAPWRCCPGRCCRYHYCSYSKPGGTC